MFIFIGAIIVLAAVIGGYILEHGNLHVLYQPVEFLIIGGAALGSFIIASTPKVLGSVLKSMGTILGAKKKTKTEYLEMLALLYELFQKMRKEGLIAVESDVENPPESPIFSKYKSVLSNHHAVDLICDNLKVITTTNLQPHELENVIDIEIETHHHEAMVPVHAITKISDALPGLGIVAAVLGVVITMGKISEPPEVLGHSIGAALVGTFLGILGCYGFVGPFATNLENIAEEDLPFFHVIKMTLVSFVGGAAPQIAVEFGRRAIPPSSKPSFDELEEAVRK